MYAWRFIPPSLCLKFNLLHQRTTQPIHSLPVPRIPHSLFDPLLATLLFYLLYLPFALLSQHFKDYSLSTIRAKLNGKETKNPDDTRFHRLFNQALILYLVTVTWIELFGVGEGLLGYIAAVLFGLYHVSLLGVLLVVWIHWRRVKWYLDSVKRKLDAAAAQDNAKVD